MGTRVFLFFLFFANSLHWFKTVGFSYNSLLWYHVILKYSGILPLNHYNLSACILARHIFVKTEAAMGVFLGLRQFLCRPC